MHSKNSISSTLLELLPWGHVFGAIKHSHLTPSCAPCEILFVSDYSNSPSGLWEDSNWYTPVWWAIAQFTILALLTSNFLHNAVKSRAVSSCLSLFTISWAYILMFENSLSPTQLNKHMESISLKSLGIKEHPSLLSILIAREINKSTFLK